MQKEEGSARFAAVLGLTLVVPFVLLLANQLFTVASDADSLTAAGASEIFHELPTVFYVMGLGAVGMVVASLLYWQVQRWTGGR